MAIRWTGWLLALNLGWEVAQLPLYAFPPDVPPIRIAYFVLHCTLGDGGIALAAYAVAALVSRDASWPLREGVWPLALACIASIAFTAASEWRNVYVTRSWTYAEVMPTIGGIGVSPLLQWALLPPLAWWLVRRSAHRKEMKR